MHEGPLSSIILTRQAVPLVRRGTPEYRAITVGMLLGGFATFLQLYCLQSILPTLSEEFHVTPATSSYVVSAATMSLAVGLLLTSFLSDLLSRRRLMSLSLLASSVFTIAAAWSPNFSILVAFCGLKGFALSGLPAIAMAYLSEEIEPLSLGQIMGLYIGGNILGGMMGRVVTALLTGWISWRFALGSIGVVCFIMGVVFLRILPASRHFHPRRPSAAKLWRQVRGHMSDPVLLELFAFIGLMMGSFISVYNYLGFRLKAAPFFLSNSFVGAIFSMYLVGFFGSYLSGAMADRMGRRSLLWMLVILTLVGLWLMLANSLWVVIGGLALFTFGFFGSHSVASSWIGRRALHARAIASALYLFFYYVGSSVLGSATGVVLRQKGWAGVVEVLSVAIFVSLCLSLLLRKTKKRATPPEIAVASS